MLSGFHYDIKQKIKPPAYECRTYACINGRIFSPDI